MNELPLPSWAPSVLCVQTEMQLAFLSPHLDTEEVGEAFGLMAASLCILLAVGMHPSTLLLHSDCSWGIQPCSGLSVWTVGISGGSRSVTEQSLRSSQKGLLWRALWEHGTAWFPKPGQHMRTCHYEGPGGSPHLPNSHCRSAGQSRASAQRPFSVNSLSTALLIPDFASWGLWSHKCPGRTQLLIEQE